MYFSFMCYITYVYPDDDRSKNDRNMSLYLTLKERNYVEYFLYNY